MSRLLDQDRPSFRAAIIIVLCSWALIASIRLMGPSDLHDNDQARPALYALDVLVNGQWIVQRDTTGDIASKPPLYTWTVALMGRLLGAVDEWALYVPTSLAMLGVMLLILAWSGRWFGVSAGLFGALMMLVSPFGLKHLALARTDAMFCFFVCLAAFFAWRASRGCNAGRWTLFWLAAAAVTLTKGPIGVVIAAGGLLPFFWFRWRGSRDPGRSEGVPVVHWRRHVPGVALYVLLVGGWMVWAYLEAGQPFIAKVIGRELVGHAARGDSGQLPFVHFYVPPFYFLTRFGPWSILACVALRRVLKASGREGDAMGFERFLASWFLVGMVIFSIAPHQRADLLLPIIPPAAMLAGAELARRLNGLMGLRPAAIGCAIAGVGVLAVTIDRHVIRRGHMEVQRTALLRESAERLVPMSLGRTFMDEGAPLLMQVFMQRHVHRAEEGSVMRALASGEPILVVSSRSEAPAGAVERLRVEDPARPGSILLMAYENVGEPAR